MEESLPGKQSSAWDGNHNLKTTFLNLGAAIVRCRNTEPIARSGSVAEDEPVEVWVVAERIEIMIVLRSNTEIRLEIEGTLERLEREID